MGVVELLTGAQPVLAAVGLLVDALPLLVLAIDHARLCGEVASMRRGVERGGCGGRAEGGN